MERSQGVEKTVVVKNKGIETLHSFAVKRRDETHDMMLKIVDNITVHVVYRKIYVNGRMTPESIRRRIGKSLFRFQNL